MSAEGCAGNVCDDRSDRDSQNLDLGQSFELAEGMRCESADFIGAAAAAAAAISPDIVATHPVNLGTCESCANARRVI